MSGVRESTLAEEIRDLKDLGVEDHVIDRMMDKYNRMLKDCLLYTSDAADEL